MKTIRKILALMLVALSLTLAACSKENDANLGQIKFINYTGDTYNIVITGYNYSKDFDLGGSATSTMSINCGMYNIDVCQLNGYLFYPTKEHFTVNLTYGSSVTIELPDKMY